MSSGVCAAQSSCVLALPGFHLTPLFMCFVHHNEEYICGERERERERERDAGVKLEVYPY